MPAAARIDDPWYDALASGWGESDGGDGARAPMPAQHSADEEDGPSARPRSISRCSAVPRSRRCAAATAGSSSRPLVAFFVWYLAYVVTATSAPGLMARPVAGAVNVAMVAGLGQFLSTFLLTWAYARHARLRRDRAALELRWVVFEQNQQNQQKQQSHRPGPAPDPAERAGRAGPPSLARQRTGTTRGTTSDRRRGPSDSGAAAVQRVRGGDTRHHHLGEPQPAWLGRGVLRGRAALLAHGEWFCHRGRLHVGRLLPRHLRADRALRLRRDAVLRSASSSPGWSCCSWSPNWSATAGGSPWPTWSRLG